MNNAFANYKIPEKQKACTYYWQQKALDIIEYLDNPVKSQVFKWAKTKESKLESAIRYMKEKNINSFKYLGKIMSKENTKTININTIKSV
jgi:hypothetical protein